VECFSTSAICFDATCADRKKKFSATPEPTRYLTSTIGLMIGPGMPKPVDSSVNMWFVYSVALTPYLFLRLRYYLGIQPL
jgi:hypothetical protein